MVQSDPRLLGLQVAQQCVHESPQSPAGHRYAARRTLLVLCGGQRE